jgi:hypothetical protein
MTGTMEGLPSVHMSLNDNMALNKDEWGSFQLAKK